MNEGGNGCTYCVKGSLFGWWTRSSMIFVDFGSREWRNQHCLKRRVNLGHFRVARGFNWPDLIESVCYWLYGSRQNLFIQGNGIPWPCLKLPLWLTLLP